MLGNAVKTISWRTCNASAGKKIFLNMLFADKGRPCLCDGRRTHGMFADAVRRTAPARDSIECNCGGDAHQAGNKILKLKFHTHSHSHYVSYRLSSVCQSSGKDNRLFENNRKVSRPAGIRHRENSDITEGGNNILTTIVDVSTPPLRRSYAPPMPLTSKQNGYQSTHNSRDPIGTPSFINISPPRQNTSRNRPFGGGRGRPSSVIMQYSTRPNDLGCRCLSLRAGLAPGHW